MTEHVETVTSEPQGPPAPPRSRATVIAVLGLALTGRRRGLWAWIAPPIHVVVAMTAFGRTGA